LEGAKTEHEEKETDKFQVFSIHLSDFPISFGAFQRRELFCHSVLQPWNKHRSPTGPRARSSRP